MGTTHTDGPPEWLSIPDLCAEFGISRSTLYRLFQRGELTPTRIGGRQKVRRAAVDAYVEAGTATATDGAA